MRTIFRIAVALLVAAVLAAAPAAARAQADDASASSARKGLWNIPKQDRAEAQEMLYAFKDDILAINDQIREKMERMDAQFESRDLNETKIRSLANEILALRSTAYKKNVEFRIEFHKQFGVLPF